MSRALYAIRQVKHLLPAESLRTLYFATLHPHLSYGILAWGNAPKSALNRLALMQKKAIRYICKANYNSHTEPLFKNLNILNIWDLHEYEITLFMYKLTNHTLPASFDRVYSHNRDIQTNRITRQSSLLHIQRCDSVFASKLPLYRFPIVWNKWSQIIPVNISQNQVKKVIKKKLLSKYAHTVKCQNSRCKDCN